PVGIVPQGYDVEAAYAPGIAEVEAAVRAEEEAKSQPGRPRKRESPGAQERLDALVAARDMLKDLIARLPGWITLFHTDTAHRIVAIRFREPHSKKMAMFKPSAAGGTFGHGVFAPDGSVESLSSGDPLLVSEG